ncbi:hypothetical protein [Corallococcus llansteffanensis]|nr:hypothetical protein [Corallococcus llansteffanensis]
MRMLARGSRQRAAGMLLGLFVMGGLLPEALAQYGTSRRVARRTSRRTATRHDAMYGGATSAAVVAVPTGAATVTALPAGCMAAPVGGITYQQCGSVRYRPYYQGESLVYAVE